MIRQCSSTFTLQNQRTALNSTEHKWNSGILKWKAVGKLQLTGLSRSRRSTNDKRFWQPRIMIKVFPSERIWFYIPLQLPPKLWSPLPRIFHPLVGLLESVLQYNKLGGSGPPDPVHSNVNMRVCPQLQETLKRVQKKLHNILQVNHCVSSSQTKTDNKKCMWS